MTDTMWGEKVTEYFYSLTPDTILNAIEQQGFRCTGRCFQLNSMENRVYQIEIEIEEPAYETKQIIVKFYRPGRWSESQILEEHQFLFDLEEADLSVVAPLKSKDGSSLFLDEQSNILFTLFPKIGGRNPDEFPLETWPQIGRLIARLHGVGKGREAPTRPRLTTDTYVKAAANFLVETRQLPPHIEERYLRAVETLCREAGGLLSTLPSHRIHGDAHMGNLLHGREGYFWVDFDDMMTGPAIQDLWLLLPDTPDECPEIVEALIGGYEEMQHFDYRSLHLIEALRAFRMIHYSSWVARRQEDPYFQRAFPDFGSATYWERHLQDIEEQVIRAVDILCQATVSGFL